LWLLSGMDGRDLPSMRSGLGSGMGEASSAAAGAHFIGTSMGLLRVFAEEAVKTAGDYATAHNLISVSEEHMQKALKYQARMFFQQVDDLDGRLDQATREYFAGLDGNKNNGEESEGEEREGDESEGEESEGDESEGEESEGGESEGEESEGGESEEDGAQENEEEEQEEAAAKEEEADAEETAAGEDDEVSSVSTSNSKSTVSTVSASSLASSVLAAALAPAMAAGEGIRDEADVQRCVALARRVDVIVASWSQYEPVDPVLRMIKSAIDATAIATQADGQPPARDDEPSVVPTSKRPRTSR